MEIKKKKITLLHFLLHSTLLVYLVRYMLFLLMYICMPKTEF